MPDQDSYNAAVRRVQELLDEKIAIKEAVKDFGGDNASVIERVRHLAKLYRDASDEHHDGAVAIYERLRASPIRCRPLRIDGNCRELGEDVVSFIDAAEKEIAAMPTSYRRGVEAINENTALREQVATLTKQKEEFAEALRLHNEKSNATDACSGGAGCWCDVHEMARLRAIIATLTAERDEARAGVALMNQADMQIAVLTAKHLDDAVEGRVEWAQAADVLRPAIQKVIDLRRAFTEQSYKAMQTTTQTANLRADVERLTKERDEALSQRAQVVEHMFWGAGESDCPRDIKAANGELHTLRCKRCGGNGRKPCTADYAKKADEAAG